MPSYGLKLISIVPVFCLITACGGGSSSDEVVETADPPDSNVEIDNGNDADDNTTLMADGVSPNEWSIDEFIYSNENIISGQASTNDVLISSVADNGFGMTNGAYSGSTIAFSVSDLGTGTYTLVSTIEEVFLSASLSPGSPVAHVAIQAGLFPPSMELASTRWDSVTGTLNVVVDSDGFYRFSTVEPLIFTRESDQGTGIPGSPNQVTVFINDVGATEQ